MVCCLGDIVNYEMKLNRIGKIVKNQLLWLEKQYPYVLLDEWIIMPNHVHAIIMINDFCVGTGRDLSLQNKTKIKPLSEIIGAFKTTSSKLIHQNSFPDFKWQRSFYDHIIRNERSLNNIRDYILGNIEKWGEDRNNPRNIKFKHGLKE